MAAQQARTVYGYDANGYRTGDRVELHPGTDLWMRGARYGTVKSISARGKVPVKVELDKLPGRVVRGTPEQFRRID